MEPSSRLLQLRTQLSSQDNIQSTPSISKQQRKHEIVTFRQCIEEVGRDGNYQHNVFILMTIFWISASLFLAYPFFLFQKAHYYQITPGVPCLQYDDTCIQQVCNLYYPSQILQHIITQNTLTYKFNLFCFNGKRVFYRSAIYSLAFIGFLSYGIVADTKGRKVAMKIAWRFYTIGVLLFCITQTQLLMTFGYFIAAINCFPSLIIQFILMFQTTSSSMRLTSFLRILASGFVGSLLSTLIAEYILRPFGYIRLVIFLTVGLPALVLCFFLDYIEQSPKFLYKDNKIKAFNSINRIARKNRKQNILIDLTSSQWVKFQNYQLSLTQMLKMRQLNKKLLLLFFLLFINFFNSKSSQIGMDLYTESDFRGVLVNGATALAFFTLILTKLKVKISYLMVVNLLLNFLYFALIYIVPQKQQTQQNALNFIIISVLVLIRFASEMIYGSLLIACIECSPTVVRGKALGFILASISIAEGTARILNGDEKVVSVINLFGVLISILVQFKRKIQSDRQAKMPDTAKGYYYDEFDKFVRMYKK